MKFDFNKIIDAWKKISSEIISNIKDLKDPAKIADNIASHLNCTISEKQQLFEDISLSNKVNLVFKGTYHF